MPKKGQQSAASPPSKQGSATGGVASTPSKKKTRSPTQKSSPPSKRQKTTKSSPSKKKQTSIAQAKPSTSTLTSAPSRVLLIDNGGDTVKFGWEDSSAPQSVPNVTARLQQQWTVLAADQLSQIQNPNQLIGVTRSMERGIIVNLGNQVQVWKRVLDILGVNVANTMDPDVARAFGWKQPTGRQHAKKATTPKSGQLEATILPQTCAVILTVPPFCPRGVLDQIMTVWMMDFGFSHVGFYTSPLVSARTLCDEENPYETACVVDLGWSATNVLCSHRGKAQTKSIRRMPLGGRHLIKIWQYHCSYRQWNLMDQEFILRDCLEQSGFLSLDFKEDMKSAEKWSLGLRPFDLDYVLPDYQNTFEGSVRTPPSLERRLRQEIDQELAGDDEDDDEDEDDEDVREEDMDEEDIEDDGSAAPAKDDDKHADESDMEDEEDEDALRARLLKEREEEERRKRQLEREQQVLRISVERFVIPEALFRPSDVGLPMEWAGLAHTIHQSIQACPSHLQAAMYRSIHLVGGLSRLRNLSQRLERELRCLIPCEYEIKINQTPEPAQHAWASLQSVVKNGQFNAWSVSRDEWESTSRRGAWRRLAIDHGGSHVI